MTRAKTGASEAQRQQALLAAVADGLPGLSGLQALPGPCRNAASNEGLDTYRRNAMAHARRALSAAYPTVEALLGEEALSALARDLWREHPPQCGDLAWFGAELSDMVSRQADYTEWPWLADVARLDWAVHRAATAADAEPAVIGLNLLGQVEPAALRLRLTAGCQVIDSAWPVEIIWRAHQNAEREAREALLAQARQALAKGRRDAVLVHRQGWTVRVALLATADEVMFTRDMLAGVPLGAALDRVLGQTLEQASVTTPGLPGLQDDAQHQICRDEVDAHPVFSFAQWLTRALQASWLAAVEVTAV